MGSEPRVGSLLPLCGHQDQTRVVSLGGKDSTFNSGASSLAHTPESQSNLVLVYLLFFQAGLPRDIGHGHGFFLGLLPQC